jgi:hypothetical protein
MLAAASVLGGCVGDVDPGAIHSVRFGDLFESGIPTDPDKAQRYHSGCSIVIEPDDRASRWRDLELVVCGERRCMLAEMTPGWCDSVSGDAHDEPVRFDKCHPFSVQAAVPQGERIYLAHRALALRFEGRTLADVYIWPEVIPLPLGARSALQLIDHRDGFTFNIPLDGEALRRAYGEGVPKVDEREP